MTFKACIKQRNMLKKTNKGQVAQQEKDGIVLREDKEPKKFAHTINRQNCRARDHSSRIACNTCVFSCIWSICSGDLELTDVIKLRHYEVVRLHNFLFSTVPGNLQICTHNKEMLVNSTKEISYAY